MLEPRNFNFYQNRRQKKHGEDKNTNDKTFFNISLLLIAGAVLYLIFPLINPIIVGILTATVFYVPSNKIIKKFGKYRMWGAVTSTSAIVILVFVPLILFLYTAVEQGIELTTEASKYLQSEKFKSEVNKMTAHKYYAIVKEKLGFKDDFLSTQTDVESPLLIAGNKVDISTQSDVQKLPLSEKIDILNQPEIDSEPIEVKEKIAETEVLIDNKDETSEEKVNPIKISKEVIKFFNGILTNASTKVLGVLSTAGTMIFNLLITLLIMFYVLFDGERILKYIRHLSPIPHSQLDRLTERIRSVSRSSILGTFLTACCQGIVGIVGLSFAGIPALFLGTLIGFCSVIPVVGTAVVLVPLLGYLLIVGQSGTALFILIWSLVFNNVVDYMIRPILMKGDGNMPTVLLLFAIIGGVGRFGLLGFVYGPVLFGVLAVMLWIYEERNSLFLNRQDVK